MKELKIFKLNDGEDWWIAAYDEADALEVGKEFDIGVGLWEDEEVEISELGENDSLSVIFEDRFDADRFPTLQPSQTESGRWLANATVREWAAVSKHGDCICSSVF